MIKLDYNLSVYCRKCKSKSDLVVKHEEFVPPKIQHGLGNHHEYRNAITCHHCGNDILVGIEAYEYPIGALNYMTTFGAGYYRDDLLLQINEINKGY